MSNKNNETKTSKTPDTAVTPVTGADEALKAENEALKKALEAKNAELEAMKTAPVKVVAKNEPSVPSEERVEIFVPKGNANDEPNLLISVNGVNYLLPKGKTSKVPKFIAEEFKRSQRAVETQDKHVDKMLAEASK